MYRTYKTKLGLVKTLEMTIFMLAKLKSNTVILEYFKILVKNRIKSKLKKNTFNLLLVTHLMVF